jgi:uncharacterized protein GlcG (DUF336 family)
MNTSRTCLLGALLAAISGYGCSKGAEPEPRARSVDAAHSACGDLPDTAALTQLLRAAPAKQQIGGLFGGRFEWAAVVNRAGELCTVTASATDAASGWAGSQAVAKAKAYTANAFSTDDLPLSTARLYTLSQPGHSLWGIGAGNPFNPECLSTPTEQRGIGKVCGGTIAFGGGLALYRGGKRIGGLGVSGDTACADHEIAKVMRDALQLNPAKGRGADDIQFSQADGPTIYTHPLCPNTWRDGKKVGEELIADGY